MPVKSHKLRPGTEGQQTRTLIYGAGSAGLALLWEIEQNDSLMYDVIGLVDDDPAKASLMLRGKRVLGAGEDLAALAREHVITKVLIAIPSATGAQMARILRFALDAGVEYKMVPGLGDIVENAGLGKQLKDVAVEDLLGRKPVHLDQSSIRERIEGKVVMVTGAAGSIGSELCRQIACYNPLALVGFDMAETPLFLLDRELRKSFPHLAFHAEIGSITQPGALRHVMQSYHPSILYHAAAYKHVPMMEEHVFAAVENNIFGTWQVAQAAIACGVEDFVMISTDKAVRPASVMGATKRVAELVIGALQRASETKFVAVRFGNVLGSSGSVVPIFKEQIAAGGPVTVTHPEMSRYFMTVSEASQLVLQASAIGKGGEIFVLEMGEPVRIVDLARNLILLSGLQPERDIQIEFIGLRPGEKLNEELNMQDENLLPTSHMKIRRYGGISNLDIHDLEAYLRQFQQIVDARDDARLIVLLQKLIPDYTSGSWLRKEAVSDRMSDSGISDEQTERSIPASRALAAQRD
jgi:FlaA1/EpsC-like NDP-sugar epimerase